MNDRGATVHTASLCILSPAMLGRAGHRRRAARATLRQVIFACHSDQALVTENATTAEAALARSAIKRTQPFCTAIVVYAQPPRCLGLNYLSQTGRIGLTYWMNRLQSIDEKDPLFVTLNPTAPIDADKVMTASAFPPDFRQIALRAQADIRAMQGDNHTQAPITAAVSTRTASQAPCALPATHAATVGSNAATLPRRLINNVGSCNNGIGRQSVTAGISKLCEA